MNRKRFIHTVLILLVAAAAVSGVADDLSEEYAEQALTRALTTFAVARGLNGVISVAQGTEVALEPGGVGVMLTPGQILDPVNDLVERFSSVMLVAATSLGLQIVLLEVLSWWVLSTALISCLAISAVSLWSPKLRKQRYVGAISRLAVLLMIARFALPVMIIGTNFLFGTFLQTKHDSASSEISASALKIEQISTATDSSSESKSAQSSEEEPSVTDETVETSSEGGFLQLPDIDALASELKSSAFEMYSGASDWIGSISVSERIGNLQESAARATSHIVDLIVIFVLQTIIFPLCFLWLFVEALKSLASRSLNFSGGQQGADS